jgi:hypothetical protein
MPKNSINQMNKRLQDYMILVEEEQDHANGTYAEVTPSVKSLRIIEKIIHDLKLDNPTPSHEIHCTVTYSRRPCPSLADYEPDLPVKAGVKGFRVFPMQSGKNCLVLELESSDIVELHEYALSLGATHDYDEYTPHVTLTYDWPNEELPQFDLQNVSLTFDRWHTKPLDPEYTPGQDQ